MSVNNWLALSAGIRYNIESVKGLLTPLIYGLSQLQTRGKHV